MPVTDTVFLITLALLAVRGACRGFLRTLVGPMAFLASCGLSSAWLALTHKTFESLLILLIGPLVIGWILHLCLRKNVTPNNPPKLSLLSRTSGAIITMAWGGAMALLVVAILIILPLKSLGLGDIARDVQRSTTYALFKKPLQAWRIIPPSEVQECLSGLCGTPPKTQASLASDQDIQALMNDPRLQKLLADPATQKAIKEGNIPALMANPDLLKLAQDPALVTRMLRVYPKIKEARKPSPAP